MNDIAIRVEDLSKHNYSVLDICKMEYLEGFEI